MQPSSDETGPPAGDEADQDSGPRGRATRETLAIPQSVRELVDERDAGRCRVCGKYLGEQRALHHIRYGGHRQGMGGRREHSVDNLISICWMFGPGNGLPPCHDLVHSDKGLWLPVLETTVATLGVSAFQIRRWLERR